MKDCACTSCGTRTSTREATAFSFGVVLCPDCIASGGDPPQADQEGEQEGQFDWVAYGD